MRCNALERGLGQLIKGADQTTVAIVRLLDCTHCRISWIGDVRIGVWY